VPTLETLRLAHLHPAAVAVRLELVEALGVLVKGLVKRLATACGDLDVPCDGAQDFGSFGRLPPARGVRLCCSATSEMTANAFRLASSTAACSIWRRAKPPQRPFPR
jgi:hypothetical protein